METFDLRIITLFVGILVGWYLLKRLADYIASNLDQDIQNRYHFPSPFSFIVSLSLIAAFVVMFGFVPSFFSRLYPSCEILRNMQGGSLSNLILLIVSLITFAWLLARFQRNMWTYSGFGTELFISEKGDTRTVATKWLVMLFVPVLPVQSYEVYGAQELSHMKTAYQMKSLDSLSADSIGETLRKKWWMFVLVLAGFTALSVIVAFPCL